MPLDESELMPVLMQIAERQGIQMHTATVVADKIDEIREAQREAGATLTAQDKVVSSLLMRVGAGEAVLHGKDGESGLVRVIQNLVVTSEKAAQHHSDLAKAVRGNPDNEEEEPGLIRTVNNVVAFCNDLKEKMPLAMAKLDVLHAEHTNRQAFWAAIRKQGVILGKGVALVVAVGCVIGWAKDYGSWAYDHITGLFH